MKKTMTKLLALAMCAIMLLGVLTACGDDTDSPTPSANIPQAADICGTIMLNVNACVDISFDENGKVLNIMEVDSDGHEILADYSGYLQTGCAEVVKDLVQSSENIEMLTREFNNIIIKEKPGSKLPSETFLSELAAAAEEAAGIPVDVTVITAADQDADGNINADKAYELLLKALDIESADYIDSSAEIIDGVYAFVVSNSTVSGEYLVDCVTGYVYEGTVEGFEPVEDETAPAEEEGSIPTEEVTVPTVEETISDETVANSNPAVEDED